MHKNIEYFLLCSESIVSRAKFVAAAGRGTKQQSDGARREVEQRGERACQEAGGMCQATARFKRKRRAEGRPGLWKF